MASAAYRADGDGRVSVGRVLSRAFGFMGRSPSLVFGSALLFGALPSIASQFVTFGMMSRAQEPSGPFFAGYMALQGMIVLVGLVFSGLMQATITRGLVIEHEGGRPSFGECLSGGLRFAIPIVVLMFLWWLGVMLGWVLLFVPGMILVTMWSVAIPALVEERTGIFGAFGRSRELTKGSRWKIFGLLLMILVLFYIGLALIGLLGMSASGLETLATPGTQPPTMFLIGAGLGGVIFNLLWSTVQPSLFVELRDAKDGGGSGNLREVFA